MGDSTLGVVCLVGLVGVGAFVGAVCLIVYSGIALGNDSRGTLLATCPDADVWTWLLVVTIIMGVQILTNGAKTASEKNKDESSTLVTVVTLVLTLGLEVGLAAWGGPMIMSECAVKNLQDTRVWYLSFIHFMLQLVIISLVTLVAIGGGVVICKSCWAKKPSDAPTRV